MPKTKLKNIPPRIKEINPEEHKKKESELEEEIKEATQEIKQEASQELSTVSKFRAPPIILEASSTQSKATTFQRQTQERQVLQRQNTAREEIYSARQRASQGTRDSYSSSQYTSKDIAPVLERREISSQAQGQTQAQRNARSLTQQQRIQREGEPESQYRTEQQTRRRRAWEGR